jgi:hypothetical protein
MKRNERTLCVYIKKVLFWVLYYKKQVIVGLKFSYFILPYMFLKVNFTQKLINFNNLLCYQVRNGFHAVTPKPIHSGRLNLEYIMSEVTGSPLDEADFSPEEVAEFDADNSAESSETEAGLSSPEQHALEEKIEELELKVNGKTIKERVNLNDKVRLQKAFQMEKAAQEAFQKAAASQKQIAQMEQELDSFLQMLKNDPLKILSNPELGIKLEDLADKVLAQKIEEASKSPVQVELEKATAKLEEYEKKIKEEQDAKMSSERQRMEQEAEQHVQTEIMEAIDSGSLPKSPYIINKMAQLASIAFDNGIDVDFKDLVPVVKKMYTRDVKEMMGLLGDDDVEELVSADRIKAIRNKRIQTARSKVSNATKIVDTGAKVAPKSEKPKGRPVRLDDDW